MNATIWMSNGRAKVLVFEAGEVTYMDDTWNNVMSAKLSLFATHSESSIEVCRDPSTIEMLEGQWKIAALEMAERNANVYAVGFFGS